MNQEIFDYLYNELNITVTQSQIGDIRAIFFKEPGKHCSDDLAHLINELRSNQKAFFASKPGAAEKFIALKRSKELEKELDEFLKNRAGVNKDIQTQLF